MYSSKSLALAVPIVRKEYGHREYIVLDEYPNILIIRDAGTVGKAIVENNSDKYVFVRGGCILEGLTQPRALRYSVVAEPKSALTIDVVCVHDRAPIRHGAELKPATYVPLTLKHVVSKGSQEEVWDSIRHYSVQLMELRTTNLLEVVRSIERARSEIADVINKFPSVKDQVGVVVLNTRGVVALELFDHPKSWDAIAKNAGKELAEVLTKEQEEPIFQPNFGVVKNVIKKFLDRVRGCREREVFRGKYSYTKLIEGDNIAGEYTVLRNNVIHVLIAKSEKPTLKTEEREVPYVRMMERARPYMGTRELLEYIRREERRPTVTHMMLSIGAGRNSRIEKTLYTVLKTLKGKQLTWTEILEKLQGKVSAATINRRLKNGLVQGLITKTLRENGKPAYTQTAKGVALLEKIEEEG